MRPALLLALLVAGPPLLHAVDWATVPGGREAPLKVPSTGRPGFQAMAPAAMGIDFTNALSPQRVQLFQNLLNGSGLAAADVDGDGRVDVYLCHKQAPNQLYRNLGGGRFTNITEYARVGCTNQTSVGAVFGDLNGDGAPDLIVTAFGGPNTVLINDGQGRFTDRTADSGIAGKSGNTSSALADIDSDGDLDLYLCNFGTQAILRDGGVITTRMVNGRPQVTGRHANRLRIIDGMLYEYGEPDTLFLNDGQGRFTAVPWEKAFLDAEGRPMAPPWDFGLAVQIRDVNGDGFPDIYVCNDFQTPDRLWLGNGRGQFRDAAETAFRNMSYASMGVDFADLDRDGRYDFITVEMLSENLPQHLRTSSPMLPVKRVPGQDRLREDVPRNCLYWNRGDGTWAEIAHYAGVAATGWSWTPLFLDVDLDGWEDLIISNGHLHDVNNRDIADQSRPKPGQTLQNTKDRLLQYPPLNSPKLAYRNRRDLTFEDRSSAWGIDSPRIAHGLISLDFDDDGDLDLMMNALDGPPLVFRNETSQPRVAVRLRGLPPNTGGIGAQITLHGGPAVQRQEVVAGGQYLSHSHTQRTFAAGTGEQRLEVRWRSGRVTQIRNVKPNHLYEVDESAAVDSPPPPTSAAPAPWFADISDRLAHTHTEIPFDDFALQPLLPRLYSQLGPGVAWVDLNRDGHLDLFVGAGRGGQLGAFWGDGTGSFTPATPAGTPATDDLAGLAAWSRGDGQRELLTAVSAYEAPGTGSQPAVLSWSPQGRALQSHDLLPALTGSPGPIAVGDVDGDGDLDVFVGCRVHAGRWPAPGGSRFFRNEAGTLNPEDPQAFAEVGPAADALLVDLDGDGRAELVIAVELGPIRVFRRSGSSWEDQTRAWGLAELTGCWNSVTAGDFDGDGRLDLVAGNRGLNSYWQTWNRGQPRVVWGEVDPHQPILTCEVAPWESRWIPLRDRSVVASVLPDLPGRIPTHAAYSTSTVQTIIGGTVRNLREVSAASLESTVLLNRGGSFERRALPRRAQWSPVQGLAVADFDGDGHQDLFLAQNLFAVRPDDSRLDAGQGLLLRGDGAGGFTERSSVESGIHIQGEQRGAAAGDFDGDGRVDLVVTQNGAPTRLFHNRTTPTGLRVRLQGPPGNPDGLGTVVRPLRDGPPGAAQVVLGGGGYGSQASPVLVIGGVRPTALDVLWPDGRRQRRPVTSGEREIAVAWAEAAQ